MNPVESPPEDTPAYRAAYRRGWKAGNSNAYGSLDNAMSRGEPDAWFDGYSDKAIGREMWHSLTCQSHGNGPQQCGQA